MRRGNVFQTNEEIVNMMALVTYIHSCSGKTTTFRKISSAWRDESPKKLPHRNQQVIIKTVYFREFSPNNSFFNTQRR